MKIIGNIFLIPFKLVMLLIAIILLPVSIIISILGGFADLLLNIILGICGLAFIYQLVTSSYGSHDFLAVGLLLLCLGIIKILLAFFPATLGMLSGQIGKGLAFWF